MGVWLQGNFRSMTGEDGYHADRAVRKFLKEQRYRFMALDVHGPQCLAGRLDGIQLVEEEFGREVVDQLTVEAPRKLVLMKGQVTSDR